MEPSSKEECSSSVSGWTMYIGSPVNENDNYEDDDDDYNTYAQGRTCQGDNRRNHDDDEDDANSKSDDSMASDASSGPSHDELPWRNNKPRLDKHANSKYSWKQKLHEHKTKRHESRIKVERDEPPMLRAKDTTSQAQSGAKVRKSKQMGK